MSPFESLQALRDRPIPNLDGEREALKGARQWPIERSVRFHDPLVTWNGEGENMYHNRYSAPYFHEFPGSYSGFYLRKSIKEELKRINWNFMDTPLELYLLDAWRSQVTQTACRAWFAEHLRHTEHDWSEEDVQREVGSYWSLGPETDEDVDPESPPAHATGAAIDLTLMFGRRLMWMGTIPDDTSEPAWPDYFERHPEFQKIFGRFTYLEALLNRRMLYWIMTDAGFVVHPREWWHVSKGDQIWAKMMTYRTGTHTPAYYSSILPESR